MGRHPTVIQASRLHPDVRAEQQTRIEAHPGLCNWACGAVGRTAGKPEPKWCVRPLWHPGSHEDQARIDKRRAAAREGMRHLRERSGNEQA